MSHISKGLLAAAVCFVSAMGSAIAAPIVGSVNMYGDFQPMIGAVSTQNLGSATRIDFLPTSGTTGTFSTGSASGSFSGFANQNDTGIIKDLTISPFAAVTTFYTLTVGGSTLTFDLNALTIANQNNSFLTMTGTGLLHLTGFDDTAGNWVFSGQSSNGASPRSTFSWSAGSTADLVQPSGVPEPASMALAGLGLLAMGFYRRRKAV